MAGKKLYLVLLLLLLTSVVSDPATPMPAIGAGEETKDFIRTSCGTTLYPDVCFKSLARYANWVQQDPVQLARAAINVTLARVRSLSNHVTALSRASAAGADKWAAAALRDCADLLGDATDNMRQSAAELGRLEGAVGTEVAWRVSNAQTWMSAAMTDEGTCTDGFQAEGGSALKDYVCGRVGRDKQYTSNALALVNLLASNR